MNMVEGGIMFASLWGAFGVWRCAAILVDIRAYLKAQASAIPPATRATAVGDAT